MIIINLGGINSQQIIPFKGAISDTSFNLEITYLTTTQIKDMDWTPKELVDWLLSSHIHFVLSHIHQGLEPLCWDMDVLYEETQRLRFHIGFPALENINCPIFTQNKLEYLKCLPDMTNPTLKIIFQEEDSDYNSVLFEIER